MNKNGSNDRKQTTTTKKLMENKELDAHESMELIAHMIRNTRRRMERNTGRPFLIWGYTTVGIALMNYGFKEAGFNPGWSLTWFLIPVVGYLLMKLFPQRKNTEPRTDIDRIVGAVWTVCSLSLIPIFILCLFHGLYYRPNPFALITLTMAIGTAITGLIVRSKLYSIAGFTGMALSTSFAFYDFYLKKLAASGDGHGVNTQLLYAEILIFAAIFAVMMIVPGHILNRRSKHAQK